jgi:sporulation integral membrane protein YlbJ
VIIITDTKKARRIPDYGTVFLWAASLFTLAYFLKSPGLAAASVRAALNICASGLIPSLFPYIVLVGIMNRSGLSDRLSCLVGRPFSFLFRIHPGAANAFFLGALGGFPIGAVCTGELYKNGTISKEEAERLCAFTGNASPAFCIGSIGSSLFGNPMLGIRLYLCSLTAAVIVGILLRIGIRSRRPSAAEVTLPRCQEHPLSAADIITSAVSDGVTTMLKVCAFAVFFAVIGDAACLAVQTVSGEFAAAVCASLCELTLAGRRCAELGTPSSAILCAFAVGWSGLSVHMQTASVLSRSGIRLTKYTVWKLFQGLLSAICFLISGM